MKCRRHHDAERHDLRRFVTGHDFSRATAQSNQWAFTGCPPKSLLSDTAIFASLIYQCGIRGDDQKQTAMFSSITLAQRVQSDHPERLPRSTLLMILYSIRSERQLMEQLQYNLLFRWFVGLEMNDAVWDVTVFTKNRERLLEGTISQQLLESALLEERTHDLLSGEHFTLDGTFTWGLSAACLGPAESSFPIPCENA